MNQLVTEEQKPKRPMGERGQGRKKGSVSEKTKMLREISKKAIQQGITPLEVMLDNMRFYHSQAGDLLSKILEGINKKKPPAELVEMLNNLGSFRKMAGEAAVDAAPYCHPRLANIQVEGGIDFKLKEEQDAAFRILEGSLVKTLSPPAASSFSPVKVVEYSTSEPDHSAGDHQPTDLDRKLERLAAPGRKRLGQDKDRG